MKKFILILLMALGVGSLFAQNATLSLGELKDGLVIGNNYQVGIYVDAIDDNIKTAQFFIEFDPAVIQPVAVAPFNYVVNLDFNFLAFGVIPASSNPDPPGDELRYVITVNIAPGLDITAAAPLKAWDFEFTYLGGTTDLNWGTVAKLTPTKEGPGGSYSKGQTKMQNWTNDLYNLTLIAGQIGPDAGPTASNWNGLAMNQVWDDAGNWDVLPIGGEDIVIPAGAPSYPAITNLDVTVGELEVELGAEITLGFDGWLTATGASNFDGDLIIVEGSFIDNGTVTGGGDLYFEQMATSFPTGTDDGWHLLSSPMASFSNHDIYDYYVNTWDETTPIWVSHEGSVGDCTPAAQTFLNAGMGWSVKLADWYAADPCNLVNPGTGDWIDMDGAMADMNVGPVTYPVTLTANITPFDGWNLLGNPYPSSIDPAVFMPANTNLMEVAAYNVNGDKQYQEYTTAVPSYYLAPAQGFFGLFSDATADFALTGLAERVHGGMFYKETFDNLLGLEVTGNDMRDETMVRFIDGTTVGFDAQLDGNKMFGAENMPSLYTTTGGQELAIDVQSATEQVPMSFKSENPGAYSVAAFETSDFTEVYLQDLQTGTITDLLAGSHEFNHTDGVQNFIIHFAPVGINDINASTVNIWAVDNTIMVNVPADVTGEIAVYNMMGQEVARTDIEAFETQIKVSDVNTNYIVKVISNSNTVTGKVYVK